MKRIMKRIAYRFSVDNERHKELIDFLEDFPRSERGKVIIDAIRSYMKKFPQAETETSVSSPSGKNVNTGKIDIGKMLGGIVRNDPANY
ncbi:MAG: hypothetical protein NTX75_01210 [Proteobacteria bacterium]|nr:hypothetical protein [Pseudomonadota bacterium]